MPYEARRARRMHEGGLYRQAKHAKRVELVKRNA